MNWITTNLRIPEDIYMELKMQAAKERKSVAAIIREKMVVDNKPKTRKTDELLKRINVFAKKMAKESPGINLTEAVIRSRYEH